MVKNIPFTKMHGLGNEYIYINTIEHPVLHPEKYSELWSRPHTGIGSDGLVLIGESQIADFSMRIFNAYGSEAMMCGNASRCIGKYVYEHSLTNKNDVTLETLSGIKRIWLQPVEGHINEVTVDMGVPLLNQPEQLHAPGKTSKDNLRFITFIINTLMAVYKHNGLLKASIMSATNAHRLGANEAPPAIISSFLGKQLSKILDHFKIGHSPDT